jgi:hypothetical protein
MHIAHLDNFTVVGPFMTALLGRFACGGEVPMTSYGSTKLHVPLDAGKKGTALAKWHGVPANSTRNPAGEKALPEC